MKETMKEKAFENEVKAFLMDNGAWFVKTWSNGVQRGGIPDILACVNGYFVGVELKADGGQASELQLWNIRWIRKAGGFAMVLYPSAYERFKVFIAGLKEDRFSHEISEVWK